MPEEKAKLLLNVFDGTRQPISPDVNMLITLRDGTPKVVYSGYQHGPSIPFSVPFYNNFGDNYAVIVSANHHKDAGFHPVHVDEDEEQILDLMLLPNHTRFDFSAASWEALGDTHSDLRDLFAAGADAAAAEARYNQLMNHEPAALACLLNVTTAMAQVELEQGSPLDYVKQLIWDGHSIKQDRFFAYAEKSLLDDVRHAAEQGDFAPELFPNLFHPGATVSYKQKQFGEANLQLSFHANDLVEIDGDEYMKVEADIDYYDDPLAHAILEVIPNHFKGPTDPIAAYVLRWIAGRHAGVPEFEPPYTIEAAAG